MYDTERGEEALVGYLFTDIDGSTERWERTPRAMTAALTRHDEIIDAILLAHGGVIQDRAGDGVFATFKDGNPLDCALALQLALQNVDWNDVGGLDVRVGVHCGPGARDGVLDKASVNRAARIMGSGWGGQIVLSSAAVGAYQAPAGCSFADLGLCRLKGIDEPMRLFGLVHPSLSRIEFPPLRTVSHYSFTAAAQTSPIFGREKELTAIVAMFAETGRQVSVVGAGGNGKTRLALEVAAALSPDFLVYFVPIEAACRSDDVVAAVASVLRFPFHARGAQCDQLIEYLRDKRALIVLDNADRLQGECEFLDRALSSCPQLRILVTQREARGGRGEAVVRLAGLAAPLDVEALHTTPSCALFTQAARGVQPDFSLQVSDVATFAEICRLVGGSPLALHLTAQWISVLSLDEILARLRESVIFLSELGDEGRRHRLRDVFEGSWTLLDPEQQNAVARLAVFASGFDPQAARDVAGVSASELAVLERKCLIERREHRRFVMHPLIGDYALEKLTALSPDAGRETHRRHAEYYLSYLRAHYAAARGARQGGELDLVQSEITNIRAAWTHVVASKEVSQIRSTIEPLFYCLVLRGLFRECADCVSLKIDDAELQRYFLSVRANCLMHQCDYDAGETDAQRAMEGGAHDAAIIGHCHQALANIAHARGRFSAARIHYERAMAERDAIGDLMGSYYSGMSLAWLHLQTNNLEQARDWVQECYRLCQRMGHLGGMLSVHACAGDIAVKEERPADAEASYRMALAVEENVHHPQYRASTLIKLGDVCVGQRRFDDAAACFQEAEDIAGAIGDHRIAINAIHALGRSLRLQDNREGAKASLQRALSWSRDVGSASQMAAALLELARVDIALGRTKEAARIVAMARSFSIDSLKSDCETLSEELGPDIVFEKGMDIDAMLLELINERLFGTLRL